MEVPVPSSLKRRAEEVIHDLLPKQSKDRYNVEYKKFCSWLECAISFKIVDLVLKHVSNLINSSHSNNEFLFCSVVKNIVQHSSESVLHVLDHLKCSTSLALQTYDLEHVKPHFPLLLTHESKAVCQSKKRKKWIQTMSVLSSEEEDLDRADIQPINTHLIITDEMTALRFPYPMISDDSDEELNKTCNETQSSERKRKRSSSSDESNQNYKHKKRKRTHVIDRPSIKNTLVENLDVKLQYSNLKSQRLKADVFHTNHKKNVLQSNTKNKYKFVETDTTEDSDTEDDACEERNKLSTRKSGQANRLTKSSGQNSPLYEKPTELTSRFLSSSSSEKSSNENTSKFNKSKSSNKNKFKRLKLLSTSSSSSDHEEFSEKSSQTELVNNKSCTPITSTLKSNLNSSKTQTEDATLKSVTAVHGAKENCSDSHSKPTKESLSKEKSLSLKISKHSSRKNSLINLVEANNRKKSSKLNQEENSNSTIITDKPKEIISQNCAETSKKRQPQLQCEPELPNINSSAWKNIANVRLKSFKPKSSSSNQSKLQNLKKQFVSSNMSSVELYKQINNKTISMNKEANLKADIPKIKVPVELHRKQNLGENLNDVSVATTKQTDKDRTDFVCDNLEKIQSRENSCNPVVCNNTPHESEIDNIKDNSGEHNNILKSGNCHVEAQLNTSISQTQNEDTITESFVNKKVRLSHMNRDNNKNKCEKIIHVFNKKEKPPNKNLKRLHINNNDKSDDKDTKMSRGENISSECDVLGNILSQMQNNPYKVQRPPVKKTLEVTPEMLGWFPTISDPPAAVGQLERRCSVTDPQIRVEEDRHLKKTHRTESVNRCSSNKSGNTTSLAVSGSCKPYIYPQKSSGKREMIKHNGSFDKELKRSENKLPVRKSDNSKSLEKSYSKKDKEVIKPFYSANYNDYKNSNLEQHKHSQKNSERNNNSDAKDVKKTQRKFQEKATGNNKSFKLNKNDNYTKIRGTSDKKNVEIDQHKYKHDNSWINSSKKHMSNSDKYTSTIVRPSQPVKSQTLSKEPVKKGASVIYGDIIKSNNNLTKSTEQIIIGPLCSISPNKQGNKEIKKNYETSKGIRIRMGGAVFQIPGKNTTSGSMLNKNASVESSCKETDVTRRLSLEDTNSTSKFLESENTSDLQKNKSKTSNTNTSLTVPHNLNKENEDCMSSSEDSSVSDTTNDDSSDSTKSSSSSEESNDVHDILQSNKSVSLMSKDSVENNQTNVKECQDIKHLNSSQHLASSNTVVQVSSDATDKIEKIFTASEEDNSTSDSSDSVIVLSGSSDIDNCDSKNTKECSGNKKETPIGDESDCNKVLKVCNVGKIRVKSLQELGVAKDGLLPDNLLQSNYLNPCTSKLNELNEHSLTIKLLTQDASPNLCNNKEEITNHQLSLNSDSLKNQPKISSESNEKMGTCESQVQPLPELVSNLQKGAIIAIIRPVSSESQDQFIKLSISGTSGAGNETEMNENQKSHPSTNHQELLSVQSNLSESIQVSNSHHPTNQGHANQNQTRFAHAPTNKVEELFFKLCDELFTELVYFKIPKLVDDLHLFITHDIMKEERLKKIDQLVSSEIKLTEKRRVEKESAEVLKIRAQSFVPLFLTILNKIKQANFKTLVTALYCRIVHQLERIDPVNAKYRFKLRNVIKNLIQKHSHKGNEAVCSVFDESETSFMTNFFFVESLLLQYDKYLEEKKNLSVENSSNETSKTSSTNESDNTSIVEISDNSNDATAGIEQTLEKLQNPSDPQPPVHQTKSPTPPPPIGNLDQMFFDKLLKNIASTKTDTSAS